MMFFIIRKKNLLEDMITYIHIDEKYTYIIQKFYLLPDKQEYFRNVSGKVKIVKIILWQLLSVLV